MKNIVRNFSVAIVVFVTTFITVYYSVVYATKKQIVFDGSDILIIIFFGLLIFDGRVYATLYQF